MANFAGLYHWERFVPNLANNRELPEREQLALELATGLSTVELEAFNKASGTAAAAARGAPIKPPGKKASADEQRAYVVAVQTEIERMRAAHADTLAPLWAPFVRLAPGKHTVNGKPLDSLVDYLRLVLAQQGLFNYLEIPENVMAFNSVSGAEELFSRRPFGGSGSTDERNSDPEEKEAAAR